MREQSSSSSEPELSSGTNYQRVGFQCFTVLKSRMAVLLESGLVSSYWLGSVQRQECNLRV